MGELAGSWVHSLTGGMSEETKVMGTGTRVISELTMAIAERTRVMGTLTRAIGEGTRTCPSRPLKELFAVKGEDVVQTPIKRNRMDLQFVGSFYGLVEFMHLVFTRMPAESNRRQLGSLWLCLCDVFRS